MSATKNGAGPDIGPQQTSTMVAGSEANFAFLVHSQESLSQQTPPDIDNQRLARQKRRRTSPEDHAVLEAEYECNTKPDKTARLEIVKKVALGEKEVQIWFQNRRQVTRRKSRPLQPHEIFANLQPGSQDSGNASSSSNPIDESSQQTLSSSQTSIFNTQPKPYNVSFGLQSNAFQVPFTLEQALSGQDTSSKGSTTAGPEAVDLSKGGSKVTQFVPLNDGRAKTDVYPRSGGLSRSLSQTLPKKRRPEFPNRRSASFIIHDDASAISSVSNNAEHGSDAHTAVTIESSHPLKRTLSLVRLSMSLDGKAQVTTGTGTTPSPPRPQPVPLSDPVRRSNASLQRSFSAIETSKQEPPGNIPKPSFRRAATGRSRDARTWEFYCDKDARDALTEQAEREESGSATAAIALIKSNSNSNKAMAANPNKRNAHTQKLEAAKRLKANGQTTTKPKLGRTQSSVANMQTVRRSSDQEEDKGGKMHRKSGSQFAIFEEYNGDSDKENWLPGTRRSPPRRRPVASTQSRRILEESLRHSSSLGAPTRQERVKSRKCSSSLPSTSSEEKENGLEIDDEVAAFMGEDTAAREADELDCVQNLLSLSQAAWQ